MSDWINVIIALMGPGLVAVIGQRWPVSSNPLIAHFVDLSAIAIIAIIVLASAIMFEGYSLSRLGFERIDWWTPVMGLGLAAFLIGIFGPFAHWLLDRLGIGGFGRGLAELRQLPLTYLVVTIVLVASVEELLYRGYAIARLNDLTGSTLAAAIISVTAFALVHIPMWSWAPALTTVISGAIFTGIYLYRRDLPALMLAHSLTDIYGLVIASSFVRANTTTSS